MGNRLSKIYTRTGDDGSTGLGNGERTAKDSARVEAYGTVDEVNSAIGVMLTDMSEGEIKKALAGIQQELFNLGGELSIPGTTLLGDEAVTALEQLMDRLNESLPPLQDFVMPGGTSAGAACHMARAICRRAERRLVTLAGTEEVNATSIRYLNRLSDLLFVIARTLNGDGGVEEVLWNSPRSKD